MFYYNCYISRQQDYTMGASSYFHGLDNFNFALSVHDYCDYVGSSHINRRYKAVENKRVTISNEVANINTSLFSCKIVVQEGRDGFQTYLKSLFNIEDQSELVELAEEMQHCFNQSEECYYRTNEGHTKYYKPEIDLFITLKQKKLTAENLKEFIEREINSVTDKFTKFAKKHRMGIVGAWGSVDYSWVYPNAQKVD